MKKTFVATLALSAWMLTSVGALAQCGTQTNFTPENAIDYDMMLQDYPSLTPDEVDISIVNRDASHDVTFFTTLTKYPDGDKNKCDVYDGWPEATFGSPSTYTCSGGSSTLSPGQHVQEYLTRSWLHGFCSNDDCDFWIRIHVNAESGRTAFPLVEADIIYDATSGQKTAHVVIPRRNCG